MNKNKLGAAIAVAGIAGAFGVKLYSQYKLLKGDEETETQDTTSEAENVSTEDLDNFDFESIVNEKDSVLSEEQEEPDVTIENLEPDTNNVVDITEELLSSIDEVAVEETKEKEVAPEVVSQEETKEEESEDPKKEENYDSSMSAYKDQDIKDPSFWNKFNEEMKDK